MGKVFNSMVLGVFITIALALFNSSGIAPTSLVLLLLNPAGWENSGFWQVFSAVLTIGGVGVIVIGLAAIIKQDWVLRAGMIASVSSIVVFPFVDLFRFFVAQTNYIGIGCKPEAIVPICDYLNGINGVGQFLGLIIAGPMIIYALWACLEWVFKGDAV